jgi:hypothetical protein
MRGFNVLLAFLTAFVLVTPGFSQSTNATVTGTISDTSGALIPGVTVTATNAATGVVTTVLTNETGAYNFGSLLPGTYKVTAELAGFRTQSFTDVRLGNADQVRLNFTLQVATAAQSVEVTVAADTLLAVSSSSIGEVINQQRVADLPTVTNNVLDLYRLTPGIRIDDTGNSGSVSGLGGLGTVNITRDGVDNVGAARFGASLNGATYMSPDLIGEVRFVVAPVDAEMGRGNGQFQFLTRSGGNEFHGTGVWTVRNTALDANTWINNKATDPKTGASKPTQPNWYNNHQLTASIGGPLIKNKTFFFALWDSAIMNGRTLQNPVVLTPCARRGIFRYFDTWNNGNFFQSPVTTGSTPTIAVVDGLGNPVAPSTNPNGSSFTGSLHYASVFGTVLNPTTMNSDCSNAQVGPASTANGAWDQYRTAVDSTGFVTKLLGKMPIPNNYEVGDGLNTAGFKWLRPEKSGSENIFAVGPTVSALTGDGRKQINTKIDHNFNAKNKVSITYTYENSTGNANFENWPGGFRGKSFRHPQLLATNFTSTLSSSLINEARVGLRREGGNTSNGLTNPDTGKASQSFFPNYGGYPVMIGLGVAPPLGTLPTAPTIVNFQSSQILGGGTTSDYHDITNLWSFTDSVAWTKGKHAFKFGGEVRLTHSLGYDSGIAVTSIPRALGGDAPNALVPAGAISNTIPAFAGLGGTSSSGNNLTLRNLLDFLSGSLNQVTQFYYIQNPKNLDTFENYLTYPDRIRDTVQNEGDVFAKDDWKITKNLTLNLGVRWERYGVPYEAHGLMPLPTDGPNAIFGISGRSFDNWMKPGARAGLTIPQFVGKNSPNPSTPWYRNDYKDFGPAVGFAWQVPWFGEGKTTVRGGYQMTFQQGQVPNALTQENVVPGSTYAANYQGDSNTPYLDLTRVQAAIPAPVPIKPMQAVPLNDRQQQIYIPSATVRNPYAENITLAVTRSITPSLTLDVRYIGTLGRRQWNVAFDTNVPNFLYNGLKEAFDAARAGNDSSPALQVLEQMFKGINIAGCTGCGPVGSTVNGVLQTAGAHLRAASAFQSNLANGNYFGLATTLNTLNYNTTFSGNAGLPPFSASSRGGVIRYNGFPENFVVTNPQFTSTYMIASMNNNQYHSLETQITLRPTHGMTMQGSYTFSRNNGLSGGGGLGNSYTNPADRHADYTETTDTRKHDFRMNGAYDLPIGPSKLLLAGSSGVLARVVEGWKAGWIVNLISGAPTNVSAQSMLYSGGTPDVVGPFDAKAVGVHWGTGTSASSANYFAPGVYQTVPDPQCAAVAQNLTSFCTLNAIKDTRTNQIVLQNPLPGRRGTLGQRAVEVPGIWRFDANMQKALKLTESKTLEFRIDATDILNHAEPGTPNLNINSTTQNFGQISGTTAKSTLHRQFQAQLRLRF